MRNQLCIETTLPKSLVRTFKFQSSFINKLTKQPHSTKEQKHFTFDLPLPTTAVGALVTPRRQHAVVPPLPLATARAQKRSRLSSSRTRQKEDLPDISLATTPQHSAQDIQRSKPPQFPLSPAQALQVFRSELTLYEQEEICNYQQVYCIGQSSTKYREGSRNNGFDDESCDYIILTGDHFAYRYEAVEVLGSGSFGRVIKVYDHKTKHHRALKVIKNRKRFHQQAVVEAKVLRHLNERDPEQKFNIVQLLEHFVFRNHVCLVFELLSISLYQLMEQNSFRGLSIKLVRRFALQVLSALAAQEAYKVIHCDLKPENILLVNSHHSALKVIDYGSSCFEPDKVYTYIQSRFFRAPEIMLGIDYSTKIDMWSFGCLLVELYTGYPLFPGECEQEQMLCIMEVLGLPPEHVLKQATRKKLFFEAGVPKEYTNSRGKTRWPGRKNITRILKGADPLFIELVKSCLDWDPETRLSAREALQHDWFRDSVKTRVRTSSLPHDSQSTTYQKSKHLSFHFTRRPKEFLAL